MAAVGSRESELQAKLRVLRERKELPVLEEALAPVSTENPWQRMRFRPT